METLTKQTTALIFFYIFIGILVSNEVSLPTYQQISKWYKKIVYAILQLFIIALWPLVLALAFFANSYGYLKNK
jgi:hypothetical protein